MANIDHNEIEHRFGHHKATLEGAEATLPKHQQLREYYKGFATVLNHLLPEGREKELVFTKLEEASMFSHKAVASRAPLAGDE